MNSKSNKGITLIALIITIIVLLILAGVTINMVLGNHGIIANAQLAQQRQEEREELELVQLAVAAERADELSNRNETTMQAELDSRFGTGKATYDEATKIIRINKTGNEYEITADGKVVKKASTTTPEVPEEPTEPESASNVASRTEEGVPIPKGFEYVEGTKDTGVVIRNKADGNEFVWVPVENAYSEIYSYSKR